MQQLSVQKMYVWKPSTCTCENGKYLETITAVSVITCEEIKICQQQNLSLQISLVFLLSILAVLIPVSFYYCFIKHQQKQNLFLPYHKTRKKLKKMILII